MYYVLFHWSKGKMERDFQKFRSEREAIDFLHEKYKEIEVYRIIESAKSYHLGLVVTEELIKSVLEPEEEDELRLKAAAEKVERRKIMKQNKEALEKIEQKPELTDEEKTKTALDDADQLIEREKQRQEQKKKGWKLCTKCNSNRISPVNKKGICTPCQQERKTDRPYKKRKT